MFPYTFFDRPESSTRVSGIRLAADLALLLGLSSRGDGAGRIAAFAAGNEGSS
jgi:hypothetical protein